MITPNSTKPELATKHGQLDQDTMKEKFGNLSVNAKENYIYTRKLSEYSELNQKLYLWVIPVSYTHMKLPTNSRV
mgnify:CR=1 FL=1